ncbi:MAG: redoxin domain-containing protein [Nitrospiraceae bacterium]
MVRIGETAPSFRTAALVDGTLCYIDSAQFSDSWVMLCFVPHLGLIETSFLDRQAESRHFVRENCALLAVAPEGDVFLQPWMRRVGNLRAILLIDPLRRLHRAYAVPRAKIPARCRSFVIDPDGLLRFQVLHDLNGRGISILSEILDASRAQPARVACRRY